jgi:hypothetical protein
MHGMASEPLCAHCRERPVEEPWRPFCSARCKLLDLQAWAEGTYRIPGEPITSRADPTDLPDEREP